MTTVYITILCFVLALVNSGEGRCRRVSTCDLSKIDKKLDKLLHYVRGIENTCSFRGPGPVGFPFAKGFGKPSFYKGSIYYVSLLVEKFDINAADRRCAAIGGFLVELDTDDEYVFVRDLVLSIGGTIDFLTGTNDIDCEGEFVQKRSKKHLAINQWAHGQPDNFHGREDCVEIRTNFGGHRKLNDVACDISGKFICEVPFLKN